MKGLVKTVTIKVPPSLRVAEPRSRKICIRGIDTYATMCGLSDDGYAGSGEQITYRTRRRVTCQARINAVVHASQFLVVDGCRIEVTE